MFKTKTTTFALFTLTLLMIGLIIIAVLFHEKDRRTAPRSLGANKTPVVYSDAPVFGNCGQILSFPGDPQRSYSNSNPDSWHLLNFELYPTDTYGDILRNLFGAENIGRYRGGTSALSQNMYFEHVK